MTRTGVARSLTWILPLTLALYVINLLRQMAGALLAIAEAVEIADERECDCDDDQYCDDCYPALPADDLGFELGLEDDRQFRGIVNNLGELDEDDGNA